MAVAISVKNSSASLWLPLRSSTFRNLLIADVVSDVGTFMQSVGAAWLMVSLSAGPMYVALIQTASALPFFLLALPAGAIGDIVDRRRVILFTETWMVLVATILAGLTIAGRMSPVLLLILTFALSAGDAFETPTWRAVLPELVRKEDLPAASALNGIEFNLARAVGPALAGFVIASAGIGAASTADSRKEWISALDMIESLKPRALVAVHKRPGRPDAPTIVEETRQYIRDFDRIAANTQTANELYDQMLAIYPDRVNPAVLWNSARAVKD
jgi:MFS family permease